jgi:hypothetical protein
MANFMFNTAAHEIHNGTLDLAAEVTAGDIKVMLVNSSYSPDRDDDFVADVVAGEIVATGYTGGHGGAGRKAVANAAFSLDKANDRSEFDTDDPAAWNPLGGASNDTITGIIVFQEKTGDADSRVIYFIDTVAGFPTLPFTTTGGQFSVTVGADGWAHLKTNP